LSLKGGLTEMGSQLVMKKKVLALGKSKGMTLPPVWCRANEVEAGDHLAVEVSEEKLVISVEKQNGN
jgi:antitoxin component of MazEF toxin-antitoxin module